MKFTIDRVSFLKLLSTVNVAIGQKPPTPAFLNFKLEISSCINLLDIIYSFVSSKIKSKGEKYETLHKGECK